MKKASLSIILAYALLLLCACAKPGELPGATGVGSVPGAGAAPVAPAAQSVPDGAPSDEQPDFSPPRFALDAPMYRGTVTEISPTNGGMQIKLESYEGTDFGYPSIMMHTDMNTQADFAWDELSVGDYLEVFYGDRHDGLPPVIVAANKLLPAADVIYNGEVVSFQSDAKGSGRMEMLPIGGGETMIFNFDDSTQFYMDKDAILPGAKLNVYHKGVLTRSIPPQGFALEVRAASV